MWQRIQSLFKRIQPDSAIDELLERNKKALDKKRQEAELPSLPEVKSHRPIGFAQSVGY
jgi:hypothetical protein